MKLDWTPSVSLLSATGPLDPYYEWIAITHSAYYGRDRKWFPILIELEKPRSREFADHVAASTSWANDIRVPPIYRRPPGSPGRQTAFLTAMATRKFLEAMNDINPPFDGVARIAIGRSVALPKDMGGSSGWGSAKLTGSGTAPKAIIGVIDDGLAFAHERFRDGAASSRVQFYWDQMVPSPGSGDWDYGREIAKPAIDALLQQCTHGGFVDEDELYRIAGYVDHSTSWEKPLALLASHGTHVTDIASYPWNKETPPLPIIGVQLPSAIPADTSGATLKPQVYDALLYLLDRTSKVAAAYGLAYLPLVVNLSYGMYAGPHDRSGDLEKAIDDLMDTYNTNPKKPVLRVVLPSGNSYLMRCHACSSLTPSQPIWNLDWRIQPDDGTENFVEIWYPDNDTGGNATKLQVVVTAPGGDSTPPFTAGTTTGTSGGIPIAQVSFYPAIAPSKQKLIRVSVAPTGGPNTSVPLGPAGRWRITITNLGHASTIRELHAWVQRDDTRYYRGTQARQSYFDDANYAVYDRRGRHIDDDNHADTATSYVKRFGSFNALATGAKSIVVGGFRRSDWKAAPYSAAGPMVAPQRGAPCPDGPEVMTVSEETPSHHGLLGAGTRTGSCLALHGTSVATPQITRWVANELAAGRPADRHDVTAYANSAVVPPIYNERTTPPWSVPPAPPKERAGKGRIDFPSPRPARFDRTKMP